MLIRSQDKLQLIPLEIGSISIGYKDKDDNKRIYFYDAGSENPTSTLGLYSTKEKAIKVLDMIQEIYQKALYVGENGYRTAIYDFPKLFIMPQDSEVEE